VDVVISNCVVNLAGDKRRVLAEAFRVLRPGGRFAVSDVVVRGEIPAAVRRSAELWLGCVAGALEEREFAALLADAGFEHAAVEPTRVYAADDVRALVAAAGVEAGAAPDQLDGRLMAAFVRATKPAAAGDAAAGPPALRPARPDDLPAVRRLLGTAGLPTAGLAELFGASAADFVVADDPGAPGELAAVAGIEVCGDDALLRSVAVRAAWRGRGLARALVGRVADDAARRGLGALYLLTTTAAHYFPRLGFARVARDAVPPPVAGTVEFRGACPASATAMVRRLRP
jgi:N-acetylglutamate synthase-like GNAT family acetyltransferase